VSRRIALLCAFIFSRVNFPRQFRDANLRGRFGNERLAAELYSLRSSTLLTASGGLDEIRVFHSLDYGGKRRGFLSLPDRTANEAKARHRCRRLYSRKMS